jgi:septum formation protein
VDPSETTRTLVLGSGSPRRRDLLREAGFAFRVVTPGIDEESLPHEAPADLARRLAEAKGRAVAARVPESSCILAADTLVVLEGDVLGKPRDTADAADMLLRLAGRTHVVLTGYSIAVPALGRHESGVVESRVRMRAVDPAEAHAYASGGEPLDKAGAYAVQGEGGRFVASVEGSLSNVIGLPLEAVVPCLEALGVERTVATCRT